MGMNTYGSTGGMFGPWAPRGGMFDPFRMGGNCDDCGDDDKKRECKIHLFSFKLGLNCVKGLKA